MMKECLPILLLALLISCGGSNESGTGKAGSNAIGEAPPTSQGPNRKPNSNEERRYPDDRPLPNCFNYCSTKYVLKSVKQQSKNGGYLGFRNFSARIGARKVGQCRGHGIIGQRFTYLARFDRSNQNNPCLGGMQTIECENFLKPKIIQVRQNQVVSFPGFASLKEFSTHPTAQKLLRSEIIRIPHKYSTLPARINNRGIGRKQKVFLEVLRRVRQHRYPYIAIRGSEIGNHGIVAYDTKKIRGETVICFRDSNYLPKSGKETCQNYVYFNSNGRMMYKREGKPESVLFRFELFRDEQARTVQLIKAVRKNCILKSQQTNQCELSRGIYHSLDRFLNNEILDDLSYLNF